MKCEPPENALPLAQAFRQLSDEYAVRLIDDCPVGAKWRPDQRLVLAKFFDSRQPGEIWIRLGAPDGPWVQRGPALPELLRVRPENWPRGIVERLKKRVLQTKRSVTAYGRRGGQSWFSPRPHRIITDWVVDEVWYDVRIVVEPFAAPTAAALAPPARRQGFSKPKVEDWVRETYAPSSAASARPTDPTW